MALTKLPGSKWWIETDDVTSDITATYNKAQITADIIAIRATLLTYPNPVQEAVDVAAILTWIGTQERKDRATLLVNAMHQAYQGEPRQVEAAALQARLDELIALRERLV